MRGDELLNMATLLKLFKPLKVLRRMEEVHPKKIVASAIRFAVGFEQLEDEGRS